MGRPFAEEIAELEYTHRWACQEPIESLRDIVGRLLATPLLAVGSGGSLTTAAVASTLFRIYADYPSQIVTPLGLRTMRSALRRVSVFIATAGGSNPDVLGATRQAATAEAVEVLALCGRTESKLASEATKFSNVTVHEFSLSNDDGFLATNSLWASSVLLVRAFAAASGQPVTLPGSIASLVGNSTWPAFVNQTSKRAAALWDRDTMVILHGCSSYAAAIDLESKLTEAALSNNWIADYRHFAHGRHHWLAKRGGTSAVIAFVEETERELAERTLKEIPDSIPVYQIDVPTGPEGILIALANVFPIIKSAGGYKGIDPGRPGVPPFGRRIYRINAFGKLAQSTHDLPALEKIAIERKSDSPIAELSRRNLLSTWRRSYSEFVDRLHRTRFQAVVFDYDGTLCGPSERFGGLSKDVASLLNGLLRSNISIGIATGRGKSVRESLQKSIAKKYWRHVIVGYYNGGQLGTLAEAGVPDARSMVEEPLLPAYEALTSDPSLSSLATIEARSTQITISAKRSSSIAECWQIANHLVHMVPDSAVHLVRSSHSFDVLPRSVTKQAVIERLQHSAKVGPVLAIGDMGRWPGNDYHLLGHSTSLSVDEVSPSLTTCWNLASPGVRGVEATLEYFARVQILNSGWFKIRTRHKATEVLA